MGDVRVVARVLDDAGAGEIGPKLVDRQRKFGPEALRQRDRNRVGNAPVRSASKAARAAPLAQAPVVHPRRRGVVLSASDMGVGLARASVLA